MDLASGLKEIASLAPPRVVPPLDPDFRPAALANRVYREAVRAGGRSVPLVLALERADGQIAVFPLEMAAEGELTRLRFIWSAF